MAIPKTNSIIVRGTVEAKSAVESGWKSLRPGVLVSNESGDSAVAVERTQTLLQQFHTLYGVLPKTSASAQAFALFEGA
ncbi:hypothetical protein K1719_023430 [Acacia pycnantha]|nr:hypothetical protein K1719_023430 [Acacia pycnantha]